MAVVGDLLDRLDLNSSVQRLLLMNTSVCAGASRRATVRARRLSSAWQDIRRIPSAKVAARNTGDGQSKQGRRGTEGYQPGL